jgi:hypothetical protein
VNTLVEAFYAKLHEGIEKYVPLKKHYTPKFPIWFSQELKSLVFEKKRKLT